MQALKFLVVFMGGLILIGVGVVIYGLTTRIADEDESGGAGFGTVEVPLPAGCVIAAAASEGDRLVVRADGPAERGCQRVFVIDMKNGRVIGRVNAVATP
jgi:hypothetical protein